MSVSLGIDFDTLYLTAAHYNGRSFTMVRDAAGKTCLPTVVAYTDHGRELFGWDAIVWAEQQPGLIERLIFAPDCLLEYESRSYVDTAQTVCRFLAGLATRFQIQNGQIIIQLNEQIYDPHTVCASLLKGLQRLAEQQFGLRVDACAIAVPVCSDRAYRSALVTAARNVGFQIATTLSQIEAITLHTLDDLSQQVKHELIFVAGGSSCQAAIVRLGDAFSSIEFLVAERDQDIGAWQIDRDLFRLVLGRLGEPSSHQYNDRTQYWLVRLRQEIQKARKQLGHSPTAPITLDRHYLETLTEEDLNRVLDMRLIPGVHGLLDKVLDKAILSESEIDHVILAGELSDLPGLRELLGRRFHQANVHVIVHQEAMAQGAALWLHSRLETMLRSFCSPIGPLMSAGLSPSLWLYNKGQDYDQITARPQFGVPFDVIRFFEAVQESPVETAYPILYEVTEILRQWLDPNEFELLCLEAGVEVAELKGDEYRVKSASFVKHCWRRHMLVNMIAAINKKRQDFPYQLWKRLKARSLLS